MTQRIAGSCLCGAVAFEIDGAFDSFFLCHCGRCRKGSGSAHAANLFSTTATIKWLSGAEFVRSYRVPHTRHEKAFCSQCGSALPNSQLNGAVLVVPAGSLDSPLDVRPTAHICLDSRAEWDVDLADVPGFAGLPR